MTRNRTDFADAVMRRIGEAEDARWEQKSVDPLTERLRASAASAPALGHPAFADLPLGAAGTIDAAAMFLDLRQFTARSFWDPPMEMLRVNVAVITEIATAVQQHGGYILGFRGDGVFACFDGGSLGPQAAAGFAVGAGAWAIDAVRNALNGMLEVAGIKPVQIRVGMDYGRLDFVRVGSLAGSEVNVMGFAANFASKCEKVANSWEVVAGEGLASLLPAGDVTRHEKSPVTYTRGDQRRSYHFFDVDHFTYLSLVQGVSEQLGGRPLSAVGVT